MSFEQTEVIYYAFVFLFGCLGGLGRYLFDQTNPNRGSVVGAVFASGIWAFGAVGIWVGYSSTAIVGPMYFLAVAIFVGYFTREIVAYCTYFIKKILHEIFKRLGLKMEE